MKIIVYGKPECVQCEYTRTWMDRLELTYEYIDTAKDVAARHDAERIINEVHTEGKGTLTFPLVVVSNNRRTERWTGFKLDKIKSLRETGNY